MFQGLCKFGLYEVFKVRYSEMIGEENSYVYRTGLYLASSASAEFFADIALSPMESAKVIALLLFTSEQLSLYFSLIHFLCSDVNNNLNSEQYGLAFHFLKRYGTKQYRILNQCMIIISTLIKQYLCFTPLLVKLIKTHVNTWLWGDF